MQFSKLYRSAPQQSQVMKQAPECLGNKQLDVTAKKKKKKKRKEIRFKWAHKTKKE